MNQRTIKSLLLTSLAAICILSTVVAQNTEVAQQKKPTEKELQDRLNQARMFVRQKSFEQALADYLFVFDNSRGTSLSAVRLSFVLGDVARLGTDYPPARKALQDRRDEAEKNITAGRSRFEELQEFARLNDYLGESGRNIAMFDKLKSLGAAYSETRSKMLDLIWEKLVEAKRYDDVGEKVTNLAKQVATRIAEYKINADFPAASGPGGPSHQNYLRNKIIDDGSKAYEVLVSLGRIEPADKLVNWMLSFESNGQMFARLITQATKAGRHDLAQGLVEKASRSLKNEEDLQAVREAQKLIQKTK